MISVSSSSSPWKGSSSWVAMVDDEGSEVRGEGTVTADRKDRC